MGSAWVVDSNCFIHLGQKGEDEVLADLTSALGGGKMLITPGVEDEVATVRMRRMEGRPRLLDVLAPVLKSVPVDEADVRALAAKIGERAAPQDVDLSLMVLAHSLGEAGGPVVLVSDDFKMATTAETADLAFDSCPPSTFIERLVENGEDAARDARLRSLSRQVRASEMKYAISRREDYDVQRKLTWMVDSLLDASHDVGTPEEGPDEARLVADLTRTIRGYRVKPKRLEALGDLPDVCAPVQRLDAHLGELRTASEDDLDASRAATRALLAEVMEAVGLALAPLGEEEVELVHRAMAGSLARTESALGLMARMAGDHDDARGHLVRAPCTLQPWSTTSVPSARPCGGWACLPFTRATTSAPTTCVQRPQNSRPRKPLTRCPRWCWPASPHACLGVRRTQSGGSPARPRCSLTRPEKARLPSTGSAKACSPSTVRTSPSNSSTKRWNAPCWAATQPKLRPLRAAWCRRNWPSKRAQTRPRRACAACSTGSPRSAKATGRPRPSPVRRRPSTRLEFGVEGFMLRRSKAGPCSNDVRCF